jgi:hypothetical protein
MFLKCIDANNDTEVSINTDKIDFVADNQDNTITVYFTSNSEITVKGTIKQFMELVNQ